MDNPFSILADDDGEDDEEASSRSAATEDIEAAAMIQIETVGDDSSAEATTATPDTDFEGTRIDPGEEPPVFFRQKAYIFNRKFSSATFFGRCFLCGCAGHSQRYCPLKYCAACDEYGHSVVCCLSSPKIQISFPPEQKK